MGVMWVGRNNYHQITIMEEARNRKPTYHHQLPTHHTTILIRLPPLPPLEDLQDHCIRHPPTHRSFLALRHRRSSFTSPPPSGVRPRATLNPMFFVKNELAAQALEKVRMGDWSFRQVPRRRGIARGLRLRPRIPILPPIPVPLSTPTDPIVLFRSLQMRTLIRVDEGRIQQDKVKENIGRKRTLKGRFLP